MLHRIFQFRWLLVTRDHKILGTGCNEDIWDTKRDQTVFVILLNKYNYPDFV